MRTITLVAYDRPGYVARAIGAMTEALLKLDDRIFDKLIFSIDPGNVEVSRVCEHAAEVLSSGGVIECITYKNVQRFGVAGNALVALSRAFEEHGSDFNLHLEDDACLIPDAAILAKWFDEAHGGPLSDYLLMAMCNHRDFGHGKNPGDVPNDPELMAESAHIPAPFAWCASKYQWSFIRDSWDKKTVPPTGWDWSLSFAMRLGRKRALHPVLSRCRNIGREGGTHESPMTFDSTQLGIAYSDGNYAGPYRVAVRIPDSELLKLDPWMLPELRTRGMEPLP